MRENNEYSGRGDKREHGGNSGHGHGKPENGKSLLEEKLSENPDMQILFVGSVNCLRHRPYSNVGKLMQEGKVSILCPSMADFSGGRYLGQIEEAILELSGERHCKKFMILCGCQWVILSTDEELIISQMKEDHGIDVVIDSDAHCNLPEREKM